MIGALAAVFWRDLMLARRIGGGGATGIVFFLCLVTVVPFAVGPDLNLLSRIGPAILWIAALLSTLLGLDRLFQADQEDGSLDLLRAAPRRSNSSCSPNVSRIGARPGCRWCSSRRSSA